jgi:phosphoadenosine phosphosulfate reductase
MYAYTYDEQTGGLLLTSSPLAFSKEPRPVYYKELDILGFDRYWNYEKNDAYPYMWAEVNNYYYRGKKVAQTKGGSCYTAPEITVLEEPEPNGKPLRYVDIPAMVEKNSRILDGLVQDTIKSVYNTYQMYGEKADVFYVAFSGGKDSVVALDVVQRALPHNAFVVLFGDTRMEFPDTYTVIDKVQQLCEEKGISFYRARSKYKPSQTWDLFGPPSTINRWCCSVHKTSPQISLLREVTGIHNFTGMAFTGVRAAESLTRSEYDTISEGGKHQGQYSCHPILDWNSAELFLYIYSNGLVLNQAYIKGNVRAGCLVCPNSSGKHEYIKRMSYKDDVDFYLDKIASTSGKTNYGDSEMKEFIDAGYWRTRKSGRELNFGQDKFEVKTENKVPVITVYTTTVNWTEWAKTIGTITRCSDEKYLIDFSGKIYEIEIERTSEKIVFRLTNCENSKNDIKFQSLFRSVIIKSLYCIRCGACEAECKNNCIDMKNGLNISDNCAHCYKCHDIHGHCLRYNSIRNKITEGKKMAGIDRYFSFGVRSQWLDVYVKYEGKPDFWNSDGDGLVPNKKKDAFLTFLKDSGIVEYNRKADGDKYTKCIPTDFADVIFKLGSDSTVSWALMLVNLAYTPAFNWFVYNLALDSSYTPDSIKLLLSDVMDNDIKGLGKRNVVDALKIFLCKTPLGKENIFAVPDITEKVTSSGAENITLNYLQRIPWQNPDPRVILYSLYKFAEGCGGYYQFTLSRLLNHDIDSDGVSPTEIFGIDRDQMEKLLTGLSVNYPEFINASFTLDLDNITLRSEKTSQGVLTLF